MLIELSNGNFARIYGQTQDFSIGSPLVLGVKVYLYDKDQVQIGEPIDVVEHKVPMGGQPAVSVTAIDGGFVAQWIDDRLFTGLMMAQVFNNNGRERTDIFELDSSYLNSAVPATVRELGSGNLEFTWLDPRNGGFGDDPLQGPKLQIFRPNGTATGPAEIVDAYRPDVVEIGRNSWADLFVQGGPDASAPNFGALFLGFSDTPTEATSSSVLVREAFTRFNSTGRVTADPDQIGAYMFGFDLAWSDTAEMLMAVWTGHDGTASGSGSFTAPSTDVFFGLFTRSGKEIVSSIRVNPQSSGVQEAPIVETLPGGRMEASWNTGTTTIVLPENIVEGTPRNDRLNGTPNADAILGLDGNDRIDGKGGNDILNGAGGNDKLTGGDGADTIVGGDGSDVLNGGDAGDVLDGGSGDDEVLGDKGNDGLDGGSGNDRLAGGGGNDSLSGGAGADTLLGAGGADLADGGDGNDVVKGGGGNDTLMGGADNDAVDGQGGNDSLTGGDGRDTLKGGKGDDIVQGDADNDVLRGNAGGDRMDGGDGNDKLYGDAGFDNITGGEGNDTIDGGDDFDLLFGSFGNDRIKGGAGNDFLMGGGGNDVMIGGPGSDIFQFTDVFSFVEGLGRDRIADFEVGVDSIDLRFNNAILDDTLKIRDSKAGLLLTWDKGQIVLNGITEAEFDTGDLLLL